MTTQFGAFLFPHPPASITVERPGRYARIFCPGHGEVVQALGDGARSILLRGSFVCHSPQDAEAILAEFEAKTGGPAAQMLQLPGREPVYAVLAEHQIERSGEGKVLPYTMRFVEVDPTLGGV